MDVCLLDRGHVLVPLAGLIVIKQAPNAFPVAEKCGKQARIRQKYGNASAVDASVVHEALN